MSSPALSPVSSPVSSLPLSSPPSPAAPLQLVCLLAPQRSSQYADLVAHLALPELQLSPIGPLIAAAEPRAIAGLPGLVLTLRGPLDDAQVAALGRLALIRGCFWLSATTTGDPCLIPIEVSQPTVLPESLLHARRYKGKTNEDLTRFLLNAARFASDYAQNNGPLEVFDPLCGGGTTLFAALIAGHNACGIDEARGDIESTVTFLHNFLTEFDYAHQIREERLRRLGHRWTFTIDTKAGQLTCTLAHGDTSAATELLPGLRPHLIVGDLPYGIQHKGAAIDLLAAALPVCAPAASSAWPGTLPASPAPRCWRPCALWRPTSPSWNSRPGMRWATRSIASSNAARSWPRAALEGDR